MTKWSAVIHDETRETQGSKQTQNRLTRLINVQEVDTISQVSNGIQVCKSAIKATVMNLTVWCYFCVFYVCWDCVRGADSSKLHFVLDYIILCSVGLSWWGQNTMNVFIPLLVCLLFINVLCHAHTSAQPTWLIRQRNILLQLWYISQT